MYAAKRAGKGRVEVFETEHARGVAGPLETCRPTCGSPREPQLSLHYQPTVCLESGAVEGVEALVRWNHPDRGVFGPAIFVPIAEASGT